MAENLLWFRIQNYPFDGKIRFTAKDIKTNAPVHLRLRVPGWAASGSIKGANADRELGKQDAGTYLDILVENLEGLDVELESGYAGTLYSCQQFG